MNNKEKINHIITALKKLYPNPKIALSYSTPWELLVTVILSAQTTDKKVNEVTPALFKRFPKFSDYVSADQTEFEKYVRQIGLYRGKTKNILASAKIISDTYQGRIPDSMKELVALPGVGRKTANVILGIIYGQQVGIAVDTHVKRLSNLFGLTSNNDPDKIEQDLMKIVPRQEWTNFTLRLILYGREYCPAHCKHTDCPLAQFILQTFEDIADME